MYWHNNLKTIISKMYFAEMLSDDKFWLCLMREVQLLTFISELLLLTVNIENPP